MENFGYIKKYTIFISNIERISNSIIKNYTSSKIDYKYINNSTIKLFKEISSYIGVNLNKKIHKTSLSEYDFIFPVINKDSNIRAFRLKQLKGKDGEFIIYYKNNRLVKIQLINNHKGSINTKLNNSSYKRILGENEIKDNFKLYKII